MPERALDRLESATDLSPLEIRFLKAVMRRCILTKDRSLSIVPGWFLTSLCEALLSKAEVHHRAAALMRVIFRPPKRPGSSDQEVGRYGSVSCVASRAISLAANLVRSLRRKASRPARTALHD